MITSDYQTKEQARKYSDYRFYKGLSQVSRDELHLLDGWLNTFNSKKGMTFADLGSGTGRIISALLRHNPSKVYAVDQSEAMLSQLKENYSKFVSNKKVQLVNQASNKTGLKSNSIDVVTAFHLIKHLPNVSSTFKEASDILRKGGLFIFDALNQNSLIVFNLGSCTATSEKALRSMLRKNNLEVTKVRYMHPLGETVYSLPSFLLPVVRIIDSLITLLIPKMGTKIFVEAKKV